MRPYLERIKKDKEGKNKKEELEERKKNKESPVDKVLVETRGGVRSDL